MVLLRAKESVKGDTAREREAAVLADDRKSRERGRGGRLRDSDIRLVLLIVCA